MNGSGGDPIELESRSHPGSEEEASAGAPDHQRGDRQRLCQHHPQLWCFSSHGPCSGRSGGDGRMGLNFGIEHRNFACASGGGHDPGGRSANKKGNPCSVAIRWEPGPLPFELKRRRSCWRGSESSHLKGNAGEIATLAGERAQVRGVIQVMWMTSEPSPSKRQKNGGSRSLSPVRRISSLMESNGPRFPTVTS